MKATRELTVHGPSKLDKSLLCRYLSAKSSGRTRFSRLWAPEGWAKSGGPETPRLNRIVAIKLLKGRHNARFEQEARAIVALNHPHICQIHDIGTSPEGLGYLVLEYIEGQPFRGPLPVEEAVRIVPLWFSCSIPEIVTQHQEAVLEAFAEKGRSEREYVRTRS